MIGRSIGPGAAGAIGCCDVVGFTAFTERYGDDAALTILDLLEDAARTALPVSGRIVKLSGDGARIWFGQANTAVPTMIDVVDRLARGVPAVPVRAGVHYGHVVWRDEEVVGRDVNVAARLAAVARPGEVLCSATARAATELGAARFAARGVTALPDIDRRIHVFVARAESTRATSR